MSSSLPKYFRQNLRPAQGEWLHRSRGREGVVNTHYYPNDKQTKKH
jgi:hypothetical protein